MFCVCGGMGCRLGCFGVVYVCRCVCEGGERGMCWGVCVGVWVVVWGCMGVCVVVCVVCVCVVVAVVFVVNRYCGIGIG